MKITSIKDERIIFARRLQQKKERIKERSFLVEGEQALKWVLRSSSKLKYLFVFEKDDFRTLLQEVDAPVFQCSDGIMKKITGTNYLIPIIGVAELPAEKKDLDQDLLVVFDGVQDFGNIGTIVRTASAFGIHAFASTSNDFDLYQRKTIDASRGTVFEADHCNFSNSESAVKALKAAGYQIVVTALEGSTIQSLTKIEKKPTAIVFGNETNGVSTRMLELADYKIQIPMAGEIDSLNVGVAAGISLYEMKLKVIMMMLNEKIKGSLGRNITLVSVFLRKLFHQKLKKVCDISADQAILLMILACDERGEKRALLKDALIDSTLEEMVFSPLIHEGYIHQEDENAVAMTEKGRELLGKIWNISETVENQAWKGFTEDEKSKFLQQLHKMQKNLLS